MCLTCLSPSGLAFRLNLNLLVVSPLTILCMTRTLFPIRPTSWVKSDGGMPTFCCDVPLHDSVFGACRHLPAKECAFAPVNTGGLLCSAASSQRPRGNKLKYLKRIAEKSDTVCLQEIHGTFEYFLNIDTVSDRITWEKLVRLPLGM